MSMSYNAMDVAKLIITDGYDRCKFVTNLRLQKLMYFVWIAYYKKKNEPLFREPFYAWKFGPVVLSVYKEFCRFVSEPIFKSYDTEIAPEDAQIIIDAVAEHDNHSTAALVHLTHRDGAPWTTIFDNGSGYNKEIPFEEIIRVECRTS